MSQISAPAANWLGEAGGSAVSRAAAGKSDTGGETVPCNSAAVCGLYS